FGRTVLVGPRRYYTAGRQQWRTGSVCLRHRRTLRDERPVGCVGELRRSGKCLVPGSAQEPGQHLSRRDGPILIRQSIRHGPTVTFLGPFFSSYAIPLAEISIIPMFWKFLAAFAMTASFVCLVLLLIRHIEHLPHVWWLPPTLLCTSLVSAVVFYTLSHPW